MAGPNGKCPANEMAVMTANSRTTVMNDCFWPIMWVVIGALPAAGALFYDCDLVYNMEMWALGLMCCWTGSDGKRREREGRNVGYVLIQRQKRCWGSERGRLGRQERAVVMPGENCYGGGTKCSVLDSQRPGFEHQCHLLPAVCACGEVTQPL